jgi:arsenate reductase
MAEALVNHLAQKRGLPVRAISAGTMPGTTINPQAVEVMREISVNMEGQTPQLLTDELAKIADRVITMGCGVDAEMCPARVRPLMEDWGLDDPKNQPVETVRVIRDQIVDRVETFLLQMAPTTPTQVTK